MFIIIYELTKRHRKFQIVFLLLLLLFFISVRLIFVASRTCFVDYSVVVFVCLFLSFDFSYLYFFVFLCGSVSFFFFFVPGGQALLKMARLSVVLKTQRAGIELNCQDSFALRLACNTYSV